MSTFTFGTADVDCSCNCFRYYLSSICMIPFALIITVYLKLDVFQSILIFDGCCDSFKVTC